MKTIQTDQYPIVIMSCDSYNDVWEPLAQSINKFWSDCPFPIFLCTETLDFDHEKIQNLKTNQRMGWSPMLINILNQLDTKNVIYLQEDYILKGKIKNQSIFDLLRFYEDNNAAYLRLIPFPRPDEVVDENLNIGIINKGSSYRTSLQAAVWDREVLLDLIDENESAWEFEKKGVLRSSNIDRPFYSTEINSSLPNKNHHRYPLDYYSTAILQGKWQKEALKILRKAGIKIDTKKRGILTRWDFYYYHQRKHSSSTKLKVMHWLDHNVFNRSSNNHRHF